jgi:oligopeptide transport system substrate-binding protein
VLLVGIFVAIGLFAAWTVTPPPDEEALPRPADTDVVLAGGTPLSWDPAVITDGISAQVITQVFEGLTVLDAESRVRPALAESWRLEQDGRRLVFELRDGLTFSDGSALTADDVRRSWLRVIDPASPSPFSSLLDDVAGAAAYARGEVGVEDVGISADGRTLTLDFEHPAAFFPSVAAVPTLAVVPPSIAGQARGPEPDEPFVASGAFVPVEQELDQIRLASNERYWAGPAPMSRVTVITDDGGRSPVDVFEDEAVDWTRVAAADASWIRYDRRLGPQLRHTDEMAVELLGFDTTEPPFDDPAVRKAVAMAVDWRRLAELDGDDVLPSSIVPPGVVARADGDYLQAHDPDGAQDVLAAAGYPGGAGFPPVSLATYGVGPSEAIAAELEAVLGIEVDVELRPFEQHSQLLDRETPDMWTLAWSADYPHAHDFLGLLLLSGSSANASGWSRPDYDALVEAAAATSDEVEQAALYDEAQAILREEAPLIPLGYGSSWWLAREDLRGDGLSGTGILRYADLEWAG